MKQLSRMTLLLAVLALSACASFQTPHSTNGGVAYGGSTLQAVQDTAAAQYPYMTRAQTRRVHGLIEQAQTVRDSAVRAAQAGNTDAANNRLQTLNSILSQIQAALQETNDGQ